ncbi:MAG: hypothetical protein ACJAUR_000102 [Ulvibacter sp.]|jgi:hypothetical protein
MLPKQKESLELELSLRKLALSLIVGKKSKKSLSIIVLMVLER